MPAPIEGIILQSPLPAQVCVVGSGMPNAMVLCTLSESAKKQEPDILTKKLQEILTNVNNGLEHHEQLSRLIILPDEWTVANGLLTPTLKIKRKMIDASFGRQYEGWSRVSGNIIFV